VAVTYAEACRTVARLRVEQEAKADGGGVVLSPQRPDTRTFISTFFFAYAASASDLLEVLQGLVCGVDLRSERPHDLHPASVTIWIQTDANLQQVWRLVWSRHVILPLKSRRQTKQPLYAP
jgi:hypothetical protein